MVEEVGALQQEIVSKPKVNVEAGQRKPLGEGAKKILGFLRRNKEEVKQNPDIALKQIAEGVTAENQSQKDEGGNTANNLDNNDSADKTQDQNSSDTLSQKQEGGLEPQQPASQTKENTLGNESPNNPDQRALLERANLLLQEFRKIGEILKYVKDNDLVNAAVIAGIGIIASLAGAPSELGMVAEVASVGMTMGGTPQEKFRNVATGIMGFAATQGLEHIPMGGVEQTLDMAAGFSDMGKSMIKEVAKKEITRKIVSTARNRMTPKPSPAKA